MKTWAHTETLAPGCSAQSYADILGAILIIFVVNPTLLGGKSRETRSYFGWRTQVFKVSGCTG